MLKINWLQEKFRLESTCFSLSKILNNTIFFIEIPETCQFCYLGNSTIRIHFQEQNIYQRFGTLAMLHLNRRFIKMTRTPTKFILSDDIRRSHNIIEILAFDKTL